MEHTHPKEYACVRAKECAGENGFVFSTRDERIHGDPITGTTSMPVIQKNGSASMILHRLTNMDTFEETFTPRIRKPSF
jgi:hypothetical protein